MRPPSVPRVDVNFAALTFNQIENPAERRRFNAMPATFHLKRSQVDELRHLAGALLDQSLEYRHFVGELPPARSAPSPDSGGSEQWPKAGDHPLP